MNRSVLRASSLVGLALIVWFAAAHAGTHEAVLDGSQEVPPVNTPANGVAKLILDKNAMTLHINLTFGGLLGAQTAAHIHGPAPPGQNAGVLLGLPLGNVNQTFNIDAATQNAIQAGLAYFNVHSTVFPGGEIRGQIVPQPVSVDSESWAGIKSLYK